MARAVVIGGSGHVGTYLVPRLVEAGFEVVNVSRGERKPYTPHAAWKEVRTVVADRDGGGKGGTFGQRIRELKPDIVVDMICFTLDSARHLVEALRRARPALPPRRHDLGAWAERRGADDRDGAAPAVRRIRRRQGGDRGLSPRRGAAERLSGDDRPSRPHCRPRLGAAQPGRPLQPAGLHHARPRRGAGAAEFRPRDRPPRPRRRCRADVHARDRRLERLGRRGLPHGLAAGAEPPRLRRGAWPHGSARRRASLPAVAGVEGAAERGRGDGDLGAHLPQPQLEHRQGRTPARLPAALHLARGRAGGGDLARRAGHRQTTP